MSRCQAVWNNIHIQPNGNTLPCCAWPSSVPFDRDAVKTQMSLEQSVEGCAICTAQEATNQYSLRQYYNKQQPADDIVSVDLSADNVCNLQCIMCSSEYSHQNTHREQLFLGQRYNPDTVSSNTLYTDINWSNVRYLKLFGGEPTYSPGIAKFLDWAEDRIDFTRIRIEVVTNNIQLPTTQLDAVLRRCAGVRVLVSKDGTQGVNQMIRQGTPNNYNEDDHFDYWESVGNELWINTAVSIYNALDQVNLQQWIHDHRSRWGQHFEMVQTPHQLNLQNMPKDLKAAYAAQPMPLEILQWMQADGTDLFDQFLSINGAFHQLYTMNLERNNPVLYNYTQASKQTPSGFDTIKEQYI